jgi:hypothetical protein
MDQLMQGLIRGRAAIGTGAFLAPTLTGRLFGLNPAANPQAPFISRLFASRDVALAAGLAMSSDSDRTRWLQAGIACDVADAVAAILAGRSGQLSKFSSALITLTGLSGAASGVVALLSKQPDSA